MKNKKTTHYLSYLAIKTFLYPFTLLSYKALHTIGGKMGGLVFFFFSKYRKRTLSNLSLATNIRITKENLKPLAIQSIGNLITTCLEYGKLAKEKEIDKIVKCVNPEEAVRILEAGKGVIFFCAHQANWELFFLEGSSRMQGIAIGQPVKNTYLYNWVLQIREKFGGKIILPKQAVKEGLRALRQGKFLGIVGDQGMPGSGFSSSFLGREAFTSPLPAILSYRSGCPIITATMERKDGRYLIHYSDPIWPDETQSTEQEIPRLMHSALSHLETSIKKTPSQWLWQHNKWKQQLLGKIKKAYRQDAIAVILPKEKEAWEKIQSELKTFKEIYPTELLVFFTPHLLPENFGCEEILYTNYEDIKTEDYRFKLVFNLTLESSLSKYFRSLSAITVSDMKTLHREAKKPLKTPLSQLLTGAILNAR